VSLCHQAVRFNRVSCCSTEALISPRYTFDQKRERFIPMCEVSSDTPHLASLHPLKLDNSPGPTLFQEPAKVNATGFFESARGQSFEDEFQLLICGVKGIGHFEEDHVQFRPTLKVNPGRDIHGYRGEVSLERDLVDVSGGDGLEDWLDPVTRLAELDETESYLFQMLAWG
jgi:hypothetical protein